MHLRTRWLRDCKLFVSEGVRQISVSSDCTYSLKPSDFLIFEDGMLEFEGVGSCKGVLVLNHYPQSLGGTGYRSLRALVKKISKRTDFLILSHVAEMCL
jgi:hypothetical protein